jgi:glycosyltransferase involved in cell wall biosynthesis
MILGLLPSIRGGLGEAARTGQHTRLVDGYLRPYAAAFDEVRYFSYLRERLDDYTTDAAVLARTRLIAGRGWHPWLYTLAMPLVHARALAGCSVLRVFQALGAMPAVIARRRHGVPFVTTYGFRYTRLAGSPATRLLRGAVERLALAAADAVIVTTPELGRAVAARVPAGRIHLIPNGVDTSLFHPGERPRAGPRTLVYVGRLSPEKNLATLIDAAAKLAGRFDVRVTLVGGGPVRAALAAQARALNVDLAVVDFVDHRSVPALLAGADAFVLPSFTEGHPKALLEAMSCGLPCVASDIGGNRAIVTDGETGLLFDPADPGALASLLERVLTREDEARRLGERGRAAVLARYDLTALVGREIDLLRRVAGKR